MFLYGISYLSDPSLSYRRQLLISVSAPDPEWIRILSGQIQIRIPDPDPDPGRPNLPTKKKKENSAFAALNFLFWGLKASPVAWTS
jgi:hypothetical protein